MRYVTGIHALNVTCDLETCGDWHASALKWEKLNFKESEESIFKNWGVETARKIPEHDGVFNVANHIRALIDLIEEGKFTVAQGMREDFICNEKYTNKVFDMIWKLKNRENWGDIEKFMGKEYRLDWLKYKKDKEKI